MAQYREVLSSLGVQEPLLRCATGHLRVPLEGVRAPAEWYGFPPALIPILMDGSHPMYWGIWQHWFVDRKPTFVKFFVEGGFAVEVARSVEQFLCLIVLSAIVENEGVSPEIERFAQSVGVRNLAEIDHLSLESGDSPQGLSTLPQFRGSLPLESIVRPEEYTGDFPALLSESSMQYTNLSCEFEISAEALRRIQDSHNVPSWLNSDVSRMAHFDRCVGDGRIGEAWLTLNSKGWTISEARAAISKLAEVAHDSHFTDLASSWLSIADTTTGGY